MVAMIKSSIRNCVLGCLLSTAACGSALANDNWERLGKESVGRGAREASIRVGVEEGWYRWIKLKARGGRLDLRSVRVVFADGEKLDFETFGVLVDGGETRPLPISAMFKRLIRRVEIRYELGSDSGPIEVRVLGRRAD
jgi:hypothetical protein